MGEGAAVLAGFLAKDANVESITHIGQILSDCFRSGNKALVCGNGGSACDAIHLAEEFTGRYRKDRKPLPVIPLTDSAHLTCVANDYGFEEVFARGVLAYGKPGDVLVAISTSGNSKNVIRAVEEAVRLGMKLVLLLGRDGGALKGKGDAEIRVEAVNTDRIQEVHMTVLHIVIEIVERELFPENYSG